MSTSEQAILNIPKDLSSCASLWVCLTLVSFAAVIRVVKERSSPLTAAHSSSAFLSLCYWEPITCMLLLAARQSYFSLHLLPKTRFPENGSLLLIGQFEERNAELEWAAVSEEDRYVTTLITAAKETNTKPERFEKLTHHWQQKSWTASSWVTVYHLIIETWWFSKTLRFQNVFLPLKHKVSVFKFLRFGERLRKKTREIKLRFQSSPALCETSGSGTYNYCFTQAP